MTRRAPSSPTPRGCSAKGAAFSIGVDLKKPVSILIPAYNDRRGITAAFNLNLLARINRELDGDIDLARFAHDAVWNES